ncbi:major facilitator superfamily transporter [Hypoxylon sp. FL1284]|nr:major facilitator superfamily transporter [Hypoxylon sp. FL1284]
MSGPSADQASRRSQSRPRSGPRHDSSLSHFAELVQSISRQDVETRYKEEEADNRTPGDDSQGSGQFPGEEEKMIISWEINDRENPYNWPNWRKYIILVTTMVTVINSTMGSALPSMAIPFMTKEWGVTSQPQLVLPISTFLMGYVFGPLMWGPLSEQVGRRNLSLTCFTMFLIWTMACALAPNWPAMLVFRYFVGLFASAPIAVTTGILADIFQDPVTRGRAMAWFMATTVFGPLMAPIISGFCSTSIGWRWTFWVGLIFAGLTLAMLLALPETYAPVLLSRRAAKIRKADPSAQVYAAADLEYKDLRQLATRVLTRPVRMILTELIVTAVCIYLSLIYAIFYMSFEAFPIIFQDVYGLSPGVTGLCYLPIGAGACLALPIFFSYDHFLANAQARGAPWSKQEEFRRVPLAAIGGPIFVISLFWLGWTARPEVSFVAPMLAGIPFGIGFQLIFMALLNYITDAYEIFAASANAAASSSRSIFAVVLPFATTPMFTRLGISGACSLLGGLSLVMCVIPFIFIWKGEEIRARSKFCIALKERKLEMERKNEEQQRRKAAAAANGASSGNETEKETV